MIGSPETVLIAVVLGVLPAAVLACSSWWASRTAARRTSQGERVAAGRLRAAAIADFVVTTAWLGVGLLLSLFAVVDHFKIGLNDLVIARYAGGVALLVVGVLALMTGQAKLRASRLVLQTVDSPQGELERAIERQVMLAHRLGVFYIVCTMLSLIVVFPVPAIMLVTLGILLLPIAVMQHRSRRQNQLLWLLSIAVRQNRHLANELDAHASAFGGAYGTRVRRAADHLAGGESLGMVLMTVPGLLPRWVIAAIQTAEETGTLRDILPELAEHHIRHIRSQFSETTLLGITVHATLLLLIINGLVGFLMIFIVPKLKAIFEGFGTELPRITEIMILLSDTLVAFSPLVIPVVLCVLGMIWPLAISEVDSWRNLRTRFLTYWYPIWDGPDVLRHLARQIAAGRPIDRALHAIGGCHQRPSIRTRMEAVLLRVDEGESCWAALREQRFISSTDSELIDAAQRTGNLPWALRQLAESRERRLRYRVTIMLEVLRPVVVLGTGAMVALVCVAFFMPLIKLLNDLS